MNSLDKAILNFVNKASRRIKANFLVNLSIAGIKILLCLIFSLLILSLFITIPYVEEISIGIFIVGLIGVVIFGMIKGPKKDKVALIVDSNGLNERVTTALQFINCDDKVSEAQKKDTVEYINKFDIKKNLKITIDKKQLFLCFGLIVMCVLVLFVPTKSRKEANNIREFNEVKNTVIEKIEKEKKEIEKAEDLTKEEKEEIKKILEDSIKEVKESEKKSEINKTMERLEKKLEDKKEQLSNDKAKEALEKTKKNLSDEFNKEKEENAKKDLNKLVNELNKKDEGKALADSILSGDNEGVKNQLEALQNQLENMSTAELNALAEALENAALDMNDEELAEALQNAANSILNENMDLGDLSQALASTMNNSNLSSQSNQQQQGENTGQGQGNGNSSSSGQGGQGQGGSGAGTGQGQGSGSGAGWNMGSTEGKENDTKNESSEQVYIPGRNEGGDDNLTGNKNQDGNTQQIESSSGLNTSGEKVNYDKVIGDYSNSALEGANNSNLPQSLKDLIKNYFDGLN